MAVRKTPQKSDSAALEATSDLIEERVVAFAEQLGSLIGMVQARTEGWLDHKTLSKEVVRIRESASDLLDEMNRRGASRRKPAAKQAAAPPMRVSRGPVDAPGKHHRKPPPQERLEKRMGEPEGRQMGQKSARGTGRRGGRRR